MAGGQGLTSGQGSVSPSDTLPLVGSELVGGIGTLVPEEAPENVALTGEGFTSAVGTAAPGRLVLLKSRKIAGGTASRAIIGIAIGPDIGSVVPASAKTPLGLSFSSEQGAFTKVRTRALTGSAVTTQAGTVVPTGDASWPLTVPAITFTQGVASNHNLAQYTSGFDSGIHNIVLDENSPALPTGVTLSGAGVLSYNGVGPDASVSGYIFEIENKVASVQLLGQSVTLSAGTVSTGSSLADFQSRASGPNVVWWHNFDAAAEVNQFRWTGEQTIQNWGGNDPNSLEAGSQYVTHVASGGADGGGYMRLIYPLGSASGRGESYWWRPFNALTGATNGRGVNDPGASGTIATVAWPVTSGGTTTRLWTATASNPGFYGHSTHVAANPTKYQGTDFYLQHRIRKLQTPGAPPDGGGFNNIVGKSCWFNITLDTSTANEIVVYGQAASEDVVGQQGRHRMYEGRNRSGGPGIGGDNETDTIDNSNQPGDWRYSGGWDTILYHITPGTNNGTGTNRTRIEVWAQHDPTLFPAESGVYVKIWDVLYSAAYETLANSLGSPAFGGWNAILFAIYHNNSVFTTTQFTFDYDQVIFSKATIPAPTA